jgi:hypothetical protein
VRSPSRSISTCDGRRGSTNYPIAIRKNSQADPFAALTASALAETILFEVHDRLQIAETADPRRMLLAKAAVPRRRRGQSSP